MNLMKKIVVVCVLSIVALAAYDIITNYAVPYAKGYKNEASVGEYQIQMDAGWYPYGVSTQLQSVSFVKVGIISKLSPGHLDVHILKEPQPDFLQKIKENSDVYRKYKWGTVLRFKDSFYKDVMKINHKGADTSYFVPEMNAFIDVLRPENLDSIRDIHKNEPKS